MSGINPYEHVPVAHLEVIEIALDLYRWFVADCFPVVEHGWDDDAAAVRTAIEQERLRRSPPPDSP